MSFNEHASKLAWSIGLTLVKKGVEWLISSDVLSKVRAGVVEMLDSDDSGTEKRETVKTMAQDFAEETGKSLDGDLLDIAVRAVYLGVIGGKQT